MSCTRPYLNWRVWRYTNYTLLSINTQFHMKYTGFKSGQKWSPKGHSCVKQLLLVKSHFCPLLRCFYNIGFDKMCSKMTHDLTRKSPFSLVFTICAAWAHNIACYIISLYGQNGHRKGPDIVYYLSPGYLNSDIMINMCDYLCKMWD